MDLASPAAPPRAADAREMLVQERLRLRNRQHAAGYTASQALSAELQAYVLAGIRAHGGRHPGCRRPSSGKHLRLGQRLSPPAP
jgi:hypothetical protein